MTAGCEAAVCAAVSMLQGVHAAESTACNTYNICIEQHDPARHCSTASGEQTSPSFFEQHGSNCRVNSARDCYCHRSTGRLLLLQP